MIFEIKINCDNDAFASDDGSVFNRNDEVARILREAADELENEMPSNGRALIDRNGARVGAYDFNYD